MLQKNKLASVVICYFPDISLLKKLLAVLTKETGLAILVNNGGMEESVEELQRLFHGLTILDFEENIGISRALNFAFERARESNCTHIVSFDQDSSIDTHTLRSLVSDFNAVQATGENVAAIGPRFYDPRKSRDGRYSVEGTTNAVINRPISQLYIITSGCLASIEAWAATQGFDDSLFIDLVDVDWCWRLERHGYKVYMSSQAEMAHQLSDGMNKFFKNIVFNTYSPIRRYYLSRNSVYMAFSKETNLLQKRYLLKAFVFSLASALFSDKKRITSLSHILLGAYHALIGRMGAYRGK